MLTTKAEGICEDVLEISRGTYKGQQIIVRSDNEQYFAIDCKENADTPKVDDRISIEFWCNGRRWRKDDNEEWKYFTQLNLDKWNPADDSSSDGSPF